MKNTIISAASLTIFVYSGIAMGQAGSLGEAEYMSNCASCHGTSGKGDGAFAEFLKKGAPSLRTLSKNNGGVFPFQKVYNIIDGRGAIKGHGSSEMPVWGQEYAAKSVATHGPFFGEYYAEDVVRARILSLIDHINTLQDK